VKPFASYGRWNDTSAVEHVCSSGFVLPRRASGSPVSELPNHEPTRHHPRDRSLSPSPTSLGRTRPMVRSGTMPGACDEWEWPARPRADLGRRRPLRAGAPALPRRRFVPSGFAGDAADPQHSSATGFPRAPSCTRPPTSVASLTPRAEMWPQAVAVTLISCPQSRFRGDDVQVSGLRANDDHRQLREAQVRAPT
jgi:hypothetical protein